jgi:Ca-activated chloride channel family protein
MHKTLIFTIVSIGCMSLGHFLAAKDNGQKMYDEGRYQEALKKYEQILRQHPDWEEAHFGKAAALYKTDQFDGALAELEQSIAIDDPIKKSNVFYNMANAFLQNQRLEESLNFYRRALELNTGDFDAKHNYELVRQLLQQQQEQQQEPQSQPQDQDTESDDQQQDQQSEQKKEPNKQPDQEQEQDQNSQNQTQPDQQKAEQNARQQDKESAAQLLDALREEEKELLQKRMKTKYSGIKKEKDW